MSTHRLSYGTLWWACDVMGRTRAHIAFSTVPCGGHAMLWGAHEQDQKAICVSAFQVQTFDPSWMCKHARAEAHMSICSVFHLIAGEHTLVREMLWV